MKHRPHHTNIFIPAWQYIIVQLPHAIPCKTKSMSILGTLAQLLLSTKVRLRYSLYQQIVNISNSWHPDLMYSLRLIEQLQDVRKVPSAVNIEHEASRIFVDDVMQHAISYKWQPSRNISHAWEWENFTASRCSTCALLMYYLQTNDSTMFNLYIVMFITLYLPIPHVPGGHSQPVNIDLMLESAPIISYFPAPSCHL